MQDTYLRRNLARLREELSLASARGGYPTPTLAVVTKKATDEELLAVVALGETDIAENYANAFSRRYALLRESGFPLPRMHLIGTLSTHSVRSVVGKAATIQSVDSLHLAEAIGEACEKKGITQEVLLEVNSARESAKGGVFPEDAEAVAEALARMPALRLRGLMTMGRREEDPENARPYFRETRALWERLCGRGLFGDEPVLSMGMSDTFAVAAEEGATLVRIGRAVFARHENTDSTRKE